MSFASFVDRLLSYGNDVIVVLIGLALVVFLWGLIKYVAAGDDPKKRNEGRDVIIWGVIGLTVMVGVWGFVRIVVNTIGGAADGRGYFNSGSSGGSRNPFNNGSSGESDETIHGDVPVPTNQFPV